MITIAQEQLCFQICRELHLICFGGGSIISCLEQLWVARLDKVTSLLQVNVGGLK